MDDPIFQYKQWLRGRMMIIPVAMAKYLACCLGSAIEWGNKV